MSTESFFAPVFERLSRQGVVLSRVLWVLPRIEAVAEFHKAWARFHGQAVVLGPCLQTADRLSVPRAQGPWWEILAELLGLLRESQLLAGGLSTEQVWALAQEYLEFAFRLVLIQDAHTPSLEDYLASSPFAQAEASLVIEIARAYRSRLESLVFEVPSAWHGKDLNQVVWFNDGEAAPGFWLQTFLPHLPVHECRLRQVEGAGPWLDLMHARLQKDELGLRLQVAPDETTQAQQAGACVLEWLEKDMGTPITLVVLDRLVARRVVGLLSEYGVLVDDRTGWRFSTSKVAGWFHELVSGYADTLQLNALVKPFSGECQALAAPWGVGQDHTLQQWASHFVQLLERLGFVADLMEDEAGRLLIQGLNQLAQLEASTRFSALEFLAAWSHWAESQRFKPQDVQSPVQMVPLLSTGLRQLERVVVLGCAQSHFQESPPGLLPPAVALDFGLPGPSQVRIQKISALHALLENSRQLVLLHSATVDGQPEMLLPELHWLDIVMRQKQEPVGQTHAPYSELWWHRPGDQSVPVVRRVVPMLQVAPLPNAQSLPQELRVTHLDDWVACPLRFGLTHCLPWAGQSKHVAPSFEQLRGIFVHRVLEKAARHMSMQNTVGASLEQWQDQLHTQALAVWQSQSSENQAVLYPFFQFFERMVPRVAGKLIERHAQGWRFVQAEVPVQAELTLKPSNLSITLRGRADRIEQKAGLMSIVDIKFRKANHLKKSLKKPLSLPQLPAYQAILAQPDAQLVFLALHSDSVDWVPFPEVSDVVDDSGNADEFESWGEALFEQLGLALDTFFLKPHVWQAFPGEACTHCAAFGVCRPDADQLFDLEDEEEESTR